MEPNIKNENRFCFICPQRSAAIWLAIAATATALGVSVLAGWQRGGWLAERIAWVAIGAVLVVSAHMLPALCRSAPAAVRVVATGLWIVCMVTTCYGHATFFLLAQEHAGALRVAALPSVVLPPATVNRPTVRSLAAIAAERADLTAALARADARRCVGDCPSLRVTRVSLAAKLDALNTEADEAKRQQAAKEREREDAARATAARDALRDSVHDDPVTSRLATSLGVTTARIDLSSGLVFAGVLECVACLFWFLALGQAELAREPSCDPLLEHGSARAATDDWAPDASRDAASVSLEVAAGDCPPVSSVVPESSELTQSHAPVVPPHSTVMPAVTSRDAGTYPLPPTGQPPTDLATLAQAIEEGRVRPMVAAIRLYLGCSQARAVALRRQLAERNVTA